MSNCWPTKEWNELKDGNRDWMVCTITTFYRCVACLNLIYLCLDTNVDPVCECTGLRRFFVFCSCFNFFVFHLSWIEDGVNCDMYLLVVEEDNQHFFSGGSYLAPAMWRTRNDWLICCKYSDKRRYSLWIETIYFFFIRFRLNMNRWFLHTPKKNRSRYTRINNVNMVSHAQNVHVWSTTTFFDASVCLHLFYLFANDDVIFLRCVLSSQGNVNMAISIDFERKKRRANFKCPFAIIVAARTSPAAIITATTITYRYILALMVDGHRAECVYALKMPPPLSL